jgi:hypothetical protein
LFLFVGYLESSDVSQQVIAEAKPNHCERYARVIATILTTGGTITAPGAVASCKVKHTKEAS